MNKMYNFIKVHGRKSRGLAKYQNKEDFLHFKENYFLKSDFSLNDIPKAKKLVLEIGFGDGEHLVWRAKNNADTSYIGCDVFINGIYKALQKAQQEGVLDRIRIYPFTCLQLVEMLPDKCLDQVYILFPDPWRKRRHYKRRVINTLFLNMLSKKMKDDSLLSIASDHADYIEAILECVINCKNFNWEVNSTFQLLNMPVDHTVTKYQTKALNEGRRSWYLQCSKII